MVTRVSLIVSGNILVVMEDSLGGENIDNLMTPSKDEITNRVFKGGV
jgi:hypothetical protein